MQFSPARVLPARFLLAAAPILATILACTHAQAACCYFAAKDRDIDQPGQKAFVVWHPDEQIESFTVQPKFQGNAVDFGMVIPTPSRPKLDEMPRDLFHDLAIYTILMPLPEPIWPQLMPVPEEEDEKGAVLDRASNSAPPPKDHHVTVLEAGVVGSLDYKILLAEQASGLFDWLKENQYVYSGDQQTLDFYIQKKWVFTVMKIDPKQMRKNPDGSYLGEVTPTRFTFETSQPIYPLKITQISVKDQTDALFYVLAPQQMDLPGDWSWRPSFRIMWLTYMLGCSADPKQQQELSERTAWLQKKQQQTPGFETSKLEWARKLTDSDLAVLDNPAQNYAQMGGGDLPPGAHKISLEAFLREVWADYEKSGADKSNDAYARSQLEALRQQYPADKGMIVEVEKPGGTYTPTRFVWYPNREAPATEVQGLTRLRGHLQAGVWMTKFRRVFKKQEMTDDLVLTPVNQADQQEYVRIMPTSPP